MLVFLILAIVTVPLLGWIASENAKATRAAEKARIVVGQGDPNPSSAVVCIRPVRPSMHERPTPEGRPFRPTSPKETRE
jgi:hypothetical protein